MRELPAELVEKVARAMSAQISAMNNWPDEWPDLNDEQKLAAYAIATAAIRTTFAYAREKVTVKMARAGAAQLPGEADDFHMAEAFRAMIDALEGKSDD